VKSSLDLKRIMIYLAFAFGIAWAGGLVLYLTGGLAGSPYTLLILTVVYMGAPSMAHLVTRIITREGWQNTYLPLKLREGWRYWVVAWFAPGLLSIVGLIVFLVLFPQYFDPEFGTLHKLLTMQAEQTGQLVPDINPWMVIMSQTMMAMLLAPLLNGIPTFGEEFGWRAYLLPKLMPLGTRKAIVLTGVIWGVWHWPVIAMGYNYGTDYPGAPWGGLLMMVWFTVVVGALLAWTTLRAGSVWPAVIGHGAINGIAGLGALFIQGKPNPLLGPLPLGLIGSVGFVVLMVVLFSRPGLLAPSLVTIPDGAE
jgi:membrane protease YdiL (CAAX protease family)